MIIKLAPFFEARNMVEKAIQDIEVELSGGLRVSSAVLAAKALGLKRTRVHSMKKETREKLEQEGGWTNPKPYAAQELVEELTASALLRSGQTVTSRARPRRSRSCRPVSRKACSRERGWKRSWRS